MDPLDPPPSKPAPGRRAARLLVGFLLVNLALFLAARVAFLVLLAGDLSADEIARTLFLGARLDLGLLGVETALFATTVLLLFGVRLRLLSALAAGFTGLHLVAAVADLRLSAAYGRRLDDLLFGERAGPDHAAALLREFSAADPLSAALGGLILIAAASTAVRFTRRATAGSLPLFARPGAALAFVAAALFPALFALDPFGEGPLGPAHAARTADLTRPSLAAAVANPLQEILVVHLPLALRSPAKPGPAASPPRRTIAGRDLGLRNVVLIQVEGLDTASLTAPIGEEWAMPFLRDLAEEGLFHPNGVASWTGPAGDVEAAATGLPPPADFAPAGHSLARDLRPGLALFLRGRRLDDRRYVAWAESAGCEAVGAAELEEALEDAGRREAEAGPVGVRDSAVLTAAAARIAGAAEPWFVHVVLGDARYPWPTPDGFVSTLELPRHRALRAIDAALADFVKALRSTGAVDRTVLVILGAGAVPPLVGDAPEAARLPIVFWSPALSGAGLSGTREAVASAADVRPTILALLGRSVEIVTAGRDLLADTDERGVLSSGPEESRYLTAGAVLRVRHLDDHRWFEPRFGAARDSATLARLAAEYDRLLAELRAARTAADGD